MIIYLENCVQFELFMYLFTLKSTSNVVKVNDLDSISIVLGTVSALPWKYAWKIKNLFEAMNYWPIVKQPPQNVCSIFPQLYQINLPLKWWFQLPLRLPIWFKQIFSPWKRSHNYMAYTDILIWRILNQRPKFRWFSKDNYLLQVNFKPNE